MGLSGPQAIMARSAGIKGLSIPIDDERTDRVSFHPFAAWWTVGVLMVLNACSLIDRQIISMLVVDMKVDMGLTDFQIGLLQGLAFALFYSIFGLALGSIIDRYPKRLVVYLCITVWSISASITGLARGFGTMMLARMGVGAGEGGVNPASQSLIASIFPNGKISLPMSMFVGSGSIGMALSYLVGGVLLDAVSKRSFPGMDGLAPWRQVMILTSLPGIVIALLAFTLSEPHAARTRQRDDRTSWRDFRRFLARERSLYARLLIGYGLTALITYSVISWSPTYARRVLHMTPTRVGSFLGAMDLVGGIFGTAALGWIVDRQFSRGHHAFAIRTYLISMAITLPLTIIGFLADNFALYLVAMIAIKCVLCTCYGPGMAILQIITPPAFRGRVASLMLLTISMFGFAAGPVATGAITDFLFHDPARVGASLAVVLAVVGPIATWCLWSSGPLLRERIAARAPATA